MLNLTLSDLKLGLQDLLDKRRSDLNKSRAGRYHGPSLEEQQTEIDALPPVLTGGAPLSQELEAMDGRHDGFGGAIYYTTEVYLRLPDTDPELVAAARRIRAAFIPELGELGDKYATEAARATDRKPHLKTLKDDLKRFPVAGGETLLEVATKFIAAGESLHDLLSERADIPQSNRKAASSLRGQTISILVRLRSDLAREVKKSTDLPQDLEHRVFGYFDTLASMRAATTSKAAASGDAPAGTPK